MDSNEEFVCMYVCMYERIMFYVFMYWTTPEVKLIKFVLLESY
jgi:hypothetical protein